MQGKSLADMSRLVFRDPNQFGAGERHRHTPQWLSLIDDLNDDRFSEARDWITRHLKQQTSPASRRQPET